MKTISLIGSFRKADHYAKIVEIINMAREQEIEVLSPSGMEVVDSIDNFVIFSSDDPTLTPEEIEEATIKKILASDLVYVCDVDGYIGNTTAYEVGVCESHNKDIYFLEYPIDFPMLNDNIQVVSPEEFIAYASGKGVKSRER